MKIAKTCQYCNKNITIKIPSNIINKYPKLSGFSCNDCIPKDSAARDGINESIYTED